MSSYEEIRKRNLEENRRILAEMGVPSMLKTASLFKKVTIKKAAPPQKKKAPTERRKRTFAEVDSSSDPLLTEEVVNDASRRRSARLTGKKIRYSGLEDEDEKDENWRPTNDLSDSDEDDEEDGGRGRGGKAKMRPGKLYVRDRPRVEPNRPNIYGAIEGIAVGTMFPSRIDSCIAGVHRPTVAGIHGGGSDGAYSLALSGGYEDDVDLGDCFTYTGEGGRDLKGTKAQPKNLRTAPQSCDQPLSRGNAALVRSVETGKPVRVLRGYKLDSAFAPEEGYRYDGLYTVEKWWYVTGMSGFKVYKFAIKRMPDQESPPWSIDEEEASQSNDVNQESPGNKEKLTNGNVQEKECEDDASGDVRKAKKRRIAKKDDDTPTPQTKDQSDDVSEESRDKPEELTNGKAQENESEEDGSDDVKRSTKRRIAKKDDVTPTPQTEDQSDDVSEESPDNKEELTNGKSREKECEDDVTPALQTEDQSECSTDEVTNKNDPTEEGDSNEKDEASEKSATDEENSD